MDKIIRNPKENIELSKIENEILIQLDKEYNKKFSVIIKNKSKNKIFVLGENCISNITIIGEEEGIDCKIFGLFTSLDNKKTKIHIETYIKKNNNSFNKYIAAIVKENTDIDIKANIHINKDIKKVAGHLLEENIILGNKIKIKALPMLDVHSNDVIASHGVRIEKLDTQKLFYMLSKGLDIKIAQHLIINSYIEKTIGLIKNIDKKEVDNIKNNFIQKIL